MLKKLNNNKLHSITSLTQKKLQISENKPQNIPRYNVKNSRNQAQATVKTKKKLA